MKKSSLVSSCLTIGHTEGFNECLPDFAISFLPFFCIGRRLVDKILANQIERWVYTGRKFDDISKDYNETNYTEFYQKMLTVKSNLSSSCSF